MTALDTDRTPSGRDSRPETVRVWDPLVRVFHWSLVAAFATAWLTGEQNERVHELAGYAVAGLVAVRVLWGFVGTRHARFADFVYGPGTILRYVADLVRGRARRYLGHNPAGGVMIVALLATLAVIAGTGLAMTFGPGETEALEELHEGAANAALALVALHLIGVAAASLLHGENLVAAMLTGRKRAAG